MLKSSLNSEAEEAVCPIHGYKMRPLLRLGERTIWVCGKGKKAHVLMSETHEGKIEFFAPSWTAVVEP